ncbi:MAG TPA: AMP-binding protein, partial [Jatrophihabitans sp.]|nr:AMP-binding protein [Jatrophihabitans sp.]
DGERLAVLLYTSGTSGRPKGAMLPVRALLANLAQLARLEPPPLTPEDRILLPLPLFHIFGLNAGLGMALYFGATVVLTGRFDPAESLRTIADEQVSVVVGAPLEFAQWAGQPGAAQAFAGVRYALSGSAPLTAELVSTYAGFGVDLFEGYGLTEAAPVVAVNLVPAEAGAGWAEPKPGSVGRPLPGLEVRLLDSDGEEVEPGDLGTLVVRGPNLFTGYWPDGSGGPDPDGWFATGDLAVADDDGDLYLVGRRGDLVLVNGFNVYPAEVEAVFGKLPGVREVAVLGVPSAEAGSDLVVAYVVAEPGAVLDPEALIEQASSSLARFKLPRQLIEVDTLPHTATGKVMKWRLRTAADGPVTDESADR